MREMPIPELRSWLRARPASAGQTRLVGIDGFSGAGKSTVAGILADSDTTVVSIEEFYLGWGGLEAGVTRALEGLVRPLRDGRTPRWRPWDWEHDREGPVEDRPIRTDLVLLEGCGAGAALLREHQTATLWVDAGPEDRERRLRTRPDWPLYARHRDRWQAQEQELARANDTAAASDLVVRADGDRWAAATPGIRGWSDTGA